jgi:hypothetical protein
MDGEFREKWDSFYQSEKLKNDRLGFKLVL